MKKNKIDVVFGKTLEEYNKKYSKFKYKLVKYTIGEVEKFDKAHNNYVYNEETKSLELKHELLINRKWWYINDIFYQVPKFYHLPIVWFKNQKKSVQIATCALGGVILTSAVVFPTLAATVWNSNGNISIDEKAEGYVQTVEFELKPDCSYTVNLTDKQNKDGVKAIGLRTSNDEKYVNPDLYFDNYKIVNKNSVLKNSEIQETEGDYIIMLNKDTEEKYSGNIKFHFQTRKSLQSLNQKVRIMFIHHE